MPTPEAWTNEVKEPKIEVLPLVENRQKKYPDGWCTYTYEHTQAPELEAICGGINAKTPRASGIWRQGNVLHFGFEQSPADLNDNGRALLANSIAYIARFTEDRPIVRTPSPFYSSARYMDRQVIDRLVKNKDRDLKEYLDWYLGPGAREQVRDADREKLAGWFAGVRGFLRADEHGKLVIDEEAQKFGAANDTFEFLQQAIAALAEAGERAELARTLFDSATCRTVPQRRPRRVNGSSGWTPTASICSSATPAASAGTLTRWPNPVACQVSSSAGRSGRREGKLIANRVIDTVAHTDSPPAPPWKGGEVRVRYHRAAATARVSLRPPLGQRRVDRQFDRHAPAAVVVGLRPASAASTTTDWCTSSKPPSDG